MSVKVFLIACFDSKICHRTKEMCWYVSAWEGETGSTGDKPVWQVERLRLY